MYIISKVQMSKYSKHQFWQFPDHLDAEILLKIVSNHYEVEGYARDIVWYNNQNKRTLIQLADVVTPSSLVDIRQQNRWRGTYEWQCDDVDAINVIFETKKGVKFRPMNIEFSDIELKELFSLWEEYNVTKKKTQKQKQDYQSYLDIIEVMKQDEYKNTVAIHNILK